jgi:hypothetical protein
MGELGREPANILHYSAAGTAQSAEDIQLPQRDTGGAPE